MTPSPRIVLLHGVATTAAIWDRLIPLLDGFDVVALQRPCTGSLERELDWLAERVEGRLVVGASGGATLAIALAAGDVRLAGALAHEPAVGSLAPGLLAPVAAAYDRDGVAGFGAALYGPSWSHSMAGDDAQAVARELPMFRAFEPSAVSAGQGPVLVTLGGDSPEPRRLAAAALRERLGYDVEIIDGASHFVQWDAPEALASTVRGFAERL